MDSDALYQKSPRGDDDETRPLSPDALSPVFGSSASSASFKYQDTPSRSRSLDIRRSLDLRRRDYGAASNGKTSEKRGSRAPPQLSKSLSRSVDVESPAPVSDPAAELGWYCRHCTEAPEKKERAKNKSKSSSAHFLYQVASALL